MRVTPRTQRRPPITSLTIPQRLSPDARGCRYGAIVKDVTCLVEHGGCRRVKFGDAGDESYFVSAARVRSDVSLW